MAQCRFFLQGICREGATCRFSHSVSENRQLSSQALPDISRLGLQNADQTPSRHPPSDSPDHFTAFMEKAQTESSVQTSDSRKSVACKFFAKGYCGNGDACPYSHDLSSGLSTFTSPDNDTADEHDREPSYEQQKEHVRSLFGATIMFGNGATVLKVTLPTDFSTVSIEGPTDDIKQELISQLVKDLGLEVQMSTRVFQDRRTSNAVASVRVEDPRFAKTFCSLFETTRTNAIRPKGLKIRVVASSLSEPSSSRSTSCKKVKISWHKPALQLIWLNFGNGKIARTVSSKLNKGVYKVMGQRVHAEAPSHSNAPSVGLRHHRNHQAWTVVLKDVPAAATVDEVSKVFESWEAPRHIEMKPNAGFYDEKIAHDRLRSLLLENGAVSFDNVGQQAKRFNAVAYFQEEADAREAVRALSDQTFSFIGEKKVDISLVYSAKYKVLTTIYDALESPISEIRVDFHGQQKYVDFKVYQNSDNHNKFITIRVEAPSADHVSEAAARLDTILAGKVLAHDGTPIWNRSLATYSGMQILKAFQEKYNVTITRNKARKTLTFFGPTTHFAEVEKLLADQYPPDSVVDINPTNPQFPDTKGVSTNVTDCSICWTEAESPLTTSCGHTYCLECFGDMCTAASSTSKELGIRCQGDMGKCEKPLSPVEIQEHLSSTAADQVFQNSFTSYVQRHPATLRYCPAPDCGYIYRPTTDPRPHTCTKCFETVCTGCHSQHGTMTCAEYKEIQSGGYKLFEKYKKEHGIKDCPKCRTPIEKTYGCNHMTCSGCSAHICWVCLKFFSTSGECYAHMSQKHGGISDYE